MYLWDNDKRKVHWMKALVLSRQTQYYRTNTTICVNPCWSLYINLRAYHRPTLRPGARFSRIPRTFRARKAIRKITTCLFCKADLFTCCKGNKNNNNGKVSCLETPSFWRYKENYVIRNTPEKFRDFRETGPSSRLVYLNWYSTPPASQRSGFQSLLRPECVRCARNCENHTNSFKPPQCINGGPGAFWGFLPLRKTVSPRAKNYDNFSRVFQIANQLLTRHSLY